MIGAVGVSGASSADEDQELAVIGVEGGLATANETRVATQSSLEGRGE